MWSDPIARKVHFCLLVQFFVISASSSMQQFLIKIVVRKLSAVFVFCSKLRFSSLLSMQNRFAFLNNGRSKLKWPSYNIAMYQCNIRLLEKGTEITEPGFISVAAIVLCPKPFLKAF